MKDKEFEIQMESIEAILQEADRFGLRWEVEQTAMRYLADNPEIDMVSAYEDALIDWDCVGLWINDLT